MIEPPSPVAIEPAEGTVLGLDNVPLDLPIAGAGSRGLAGFVDYTLVGIAVLAWVLTTSLLGVPLVVRAHIHVGWVIALIVLGSFVIEYGYFAGLEIALGGQTPGKKLLGLQVVSRHGGKASATALLIRNCVRTADLLVGIPMMALDATARRLGDRLAGTLVVHGRTREREVVLRRVPRGWSASDVALLEGFFRRVGELERERARVLATRFLEWIRRDDPALLEGSDSRHDPVYTLANALGLGSETG